MPAEQLLFQHAAREKIIEGGQHPGQCGEGHARPAWIECHRRAPFRNAPRREFKVGRRAEDRAACAIVLEVLTAIAPEADVAQLVADRPLRRQVGLDSIDWLNFLIGLNQRLGVDIPEADYGRVDSLNALVAYLQAA